MSKKDFTGRKNPAVVPAMQFITPPEEIAREEEQEKPVRQAAAPKVPAPKERHATQEKKAPEKKTAAGDAERKTKRLNLLMRPSTFEALTKIATMRKTSVNDLVGEVMGAYAQKEKNLVDRYDEVFGGLR